MENVLGKAKKSTGERNGNQKTGQLYSKKCKARYIGTRKRNVANGLSVMWTQKKIAAEINMQEQMIEMKKWKVSRELNVESTLCRLCGSWCLQNSGGSKRNNRGKNIMVSVKIGEGGGKRERQI